MDGDFRGSGFDLYVNGERIEPIDIDDGVRVTVRHPDAINWAEPWLREEEPIGLLLDKHGQPLEWIFYEGE